MVQLLIRDFSRIIILFVGAHRVVVLWFFWFVFPAISSLALDSILNRCSPLLRSYSRGDKPRLIVYIDRIHRAIAKTACDTANGAKTNNANPIGASKI